MIFPGSHERYPVCAKCGSMELRVAAVVQWSMNWNDWVAQEVEENETCCSNCWYMGDPQWLRITDDKRVEVCCDCLEWMLYEELVDDRCSECREAKGGSNE